MTPPHIWLTLIITLFHWSCRFFNASQHDACSSIIIEHIYKISSWFEGPHQMYSSCNPKMHCAAFSTSLSHKKYWVQVGLSRDRTSEGLDSIASFIDQCNATNHSCSFCSVSYLGVWKCKVDVPTIIDWLVNLLKDIFERVYAANFPYFWKSRV